MSGDHWTDAKDRCSVVERASVALDGMGLDSSSVIC